MSDVNELLLKAILRKVHNSEPLNNEERNYQRKLFDDMMSSKKIVQKTVRILTGEEMRKEQSSELRKSKTDADATRKDPRYTEGKNPSKIEGDKPNPDILRAKAKILDADLKPKEVKTEAERLGDKTQNPIMPRSEAVKFVSLNPVKAGDIVIKNFASTGQILIKGVVLNIDEQHGTATVKWAHGRTSHEFSHTLVKAKKNDKGIDPKLGVPKKEEEAKNPPMSKQAGKKVRQVARRVGRHVEAAYRRGKAIRGLQQVQRAPGKHARRAALSAAMMRPGRAIQEAARAIGSAAPARRAKTQERRIRSQYGAFGAKRRVSPSWRIKMDKAEMSESELERSKRLAERLKGKKGIDNPHALARHMVQQKFTKAERIEIVNTIIHESHMEKHFTPKKHPHGKRKGSSVAGEAVRGGLLGGFLASRRGRRMLTGAREAARRVPGRARRIAGRVAGGVARVARGLPGAARALAGRHPVGAAALAGAGLAGLAARRGRKRKTRKVQKDGDIVSGRESISTPVGSSMPTPTAFEDLTNVLQQTINLAAEVKTKQNRTADQEVKDYYAGILTELRGISERLLASLSMELNEAQSSEDKE